MAIRTQLIESKENLWVVLVQPLLLAFFLLQEDSEILLDSPLGILEHICHRPMTTTKEESKEEEIANVIIYWLCHDHGKDCLSVSQQLPPLGNDDNQLLRLTLVNKITSLTTVESAASTTTTASRTN